MNPLLLSYALLATVHASPARTDDAPVLLQRIFTVGAKSTYHVKAEMNVEQRMRGLQTFLPDDEEMEYTFYERVLSADHGNAEVKYNRPNMLITGAATPDADPQTITENVNYSMVLSMSSANQVLDQKDLTPKKKDPPKKSDDSVLFSNPAARGQLQGIVGSFMSEMIQLAAYISLPEEALDFEPPFALQPVKVGDTWKRTVGYQPQKLQGKGGKMAVQRLDLTYTYKGVMTSRGKSVVRIHADTSLDTDLAPYVNGLFGVTSAETGLKSIPNRLKIGLDFDLDPKTLQTLYAEANSVGGFEIYVTDFTQPVQEAKVTGKTRMNLVSSTVDPPKVKVK